MSKRQFKRWRLFADSKIQGQLLLRLIGYWIVCQISIFGTIALFSFITNSSASVSPLVVPALIVSFIFLPIVVVDAIVFSNRFAGPMVNFRSNLKRMLKGEEIGDIRFRPGDFYQDVSNDFNQLKREMFSNARVTGKTETDQQGESISSKSVGTEQSIAPVVTTETSISPEAGHHV